MTICRPRDVSPDALGMLAVQVLVPELPLEIEHAQHRPTWGIWRVTLWQHGRVWFGVYTGEALLTPTSFAFLRAIHPELWIEIERNTPHSHA